MASLIGTFKIYIVRLGTSRCLSGPLLFAAVGERRPRQAAKASYRAVLFCSLGRDVLFRTFNLHQTMGHRCTERRHFSIVPGRRMDLHVSRFNSLKRNPRINRPPYSFLSPLRKSRATNQPSRDVRQAASRYLDTYRTTLVNALNSQLRTWNE